MHSMTGYGRAMREIEGRQLTIELKSVNHRFLDVSFRMPRGLMFLEDDARKRIAAKLARGHVDVFMTYRNLRSDTKTVRVDEALLSAYMQAFDQIAAAGLRDDRAMMGVSRFPDVLIVEEAPEDQDALRTLMIETLDEALDELKSMRAREGEEMKKDLSFRVNEIGRITDAIEARYPDTVKEYTERLRASVRELIGSEIEESRLVMEVAIMADRSAIAEEIVRLNSHLGQLRELFEHAEPIGRKIDFIVQELNREVNTISSKSQDIPITQLAVDAKAEIEKLREQLQNVE